jgi:hypothetical protein
MLPLPNTPETPNIRALASFTRQRFTGSTSTSLVLNNPIVTGTETVVKNKSVLDFTADYSVSGSTVKLVTAPIVSDVFVVTYFFRSAR